MKKFGWELRLGVFLICLSIILYLCQFFLLGNGKQIIFYIFQDIAFLPISALLVLLVIGRLLADHEKHIILDKLNMVIGTFFSEVGTDLLKFCITFDHNADKVGRNLIVKNDWKESDFIRARNSLESYEYNVDSKKGNLAAFQVWITEKRLFLLRFLENPTLLEHQTFTDLLWAVFHLADELSHRHDLTNLPEEDLSHLSGDIKRAYVLLITQWLEYMRHLQMQYPYLFSLAVRTNPFDPNAFVVIRKEQGDPLTKV